MLRSAEMVFSPVSRTPFVPVVFIMIVDIMKGTVFKRILGVGGLVRMAHHNFRFLALAGGHVIHNHLGCSSNLQHQTLNEDVQARET